MPAREVPVKTVKYQAQAENGAGVDLRREPARPVTILLLATAPDVKSST
jgi:hypothetical protein